MYEQKAPREYDKTEEQLETITTDLMTVVNKEAYNVLGWYSGFVIEEMTADEPTEDTPSTDSLLFDKLAEAIAKHPSLAIFADKRLFISALRVAPTVVPQGGGGSGANTNVELRHCRFEVHTTPEGKRRFRFVCTQVATS